MIFLLLSVGGFVGVFLFTYLSTLRFFKRFRELFEFLGFVSVIHVFVGLFGGGWYAISECQNFWVSLGLGYLSALVLSRIK